MPAPDYFGRYRVVRAHAAGQMGTIFVAEDPLIGRSVAIKSLRLDPGSSAADRDRLQGRFDRETRIAGTFSHPNIVTIYDVGRQDGQPFIVMEFIEGKSLRQRLDEERCLPAPEVARLIRPICDALDYAHERGVVHRDLKPSNVMLAKGSGSATVPKITDFGVAHLAGSDLTMSGKVFGAPSYMSPEQIRDEELAGASDQFAVAIIAYEMLTGRRPFAGAAAAQTIYQVVHNEPRDPRKLNPEVPPEAARVILRALDKNPSRRYPSCGAFAEALCEALVASGAVDARPGSDAGSVPPEDIDAGSWPARRRPVIDAVLARAADWSGRLRGRPGMVLLAAVWLGLLLVAWGLAVDAGTSRDDPATTPASAGPGSSSATPAGSMPDGSIARGTYAPAPTAGATEPVDDPAEGHDVESSDDPAPGADPEAPARDPGPTPPLQLTVASRPAGARVMLDGETLDDVAPVTIRLADREPHLLRLELQGHEPLAWRFSLDDLDERHLASGRLFFPLVPAAAPAATNARRADIPTTEDVDAPDPGETPPLGEPVDGADREVGPPVAPEEVRRVRAPGDVARPRKVGDAPVELPAGLEDVSGVVIVELEINRRGDVVQARLLNSLRPAVDRAVLDAVVGWKYEPTRVEGEPVHVLMTTTVRVGSRHGGV